MLPQSSCVFSLILKDGCYVLCKTASVVSLTSHLVSLYSEEQHVFEVFLANTVTAGTPAQELVAFAK